MISGQTLYSAIGQSSSQALMIVVSGLFYRHIHENIFWMMVVLVLPAFYLIWRGQIRTTTQIAQ